MRKVAFSILVDNSFAVMTRICSLFVRRGYNIESFSVGVTEDTDTTRMTIVATGEEEIIDQLSKQVNKLADVIDVFELTDNKSIFRELVLIKVEVNKDNRSELISIVDLFRAKIIDVSPDSFIIEATGDQGKIEGLLAMLKGFNIKELVRTGTTGLTRGIYDVK